MGAGGNKEDAFIMLEELKKQVYEANMELPKRGLDHLYLGQCQRH